MSLATRLIEGERTLRKIFFLLFTMLLCVTLYAPNQASADSTERLSGNDRFEVAVNISKKGWPNQGDTNTVILAYYNAFADALSAGPLAAKYNAPILLTHSDKLTEVTKNEINRLKPQTVIIVGGEGSVQQKVANAVDAIVPTVRRIGGQDRFEVAAKIAKEEVNTTNAVVVANGLDFPDALAIAPYAAYNHHPILLVRPNNLPATTKSALAGKAKTIIVGGNASVGTAVANQLPGVTRIGGQDRYEVATNIIKQLNMPTNKVYLATGLTFADALTGSVLAAKENAPLLLTRPTSVPGVVRDLINEKQIKDFTILGGPASVSDGVASSLILPLGGKTVMVDPGHGCTSSKAGTCGGDPGAVNGDTYEATLNWQLASKVGNYLKAMGANVIYARGQYENKTLEERAAYANSVMPDLFLSIHHDAGPTSAKGSSVHYSTYRPNLDQKDIYISYSGTNYDWISEDEDKKIFYYNDNGTTKSVSYMGNVIAYDRTPSQAALQSKALAEQLIPALAGFGINDRMGGSPKDHNLYVTRKMKMPSVLFEAGFITNNDELKILLNQDTQTKRAQKVAEAVKQFLLNK